MLSLLWKFQMENTKCDLGTHPNTNVNSFEYFPNGSDFHRKDLPKLNGNQPMSTSYRFQSNKTSARAEMNEMQDSTFFVLKHSIQSVKVVNRRKRNKTQDDLCALPGTVFLQPWFL